MIDLRNVHKKFGKIAALNNVSISMNRGVTAIIGPNGAGKTTLIRLILGLLRPTSGEILVMGIDSNDRDKIIDLIGYIPEKTAVYEKMTAKEYLMFFAELKDVNANVDELLSKYDLLERADDYISTFSKGMKRRLEFARIQLSDPEILILDEPFTGLDPASRINIIENITKAKNAIVCSHDLHEVELVADEVIMLKNGSVLLHDNINNLITRVKNVKVTIKGIFEDCTAKELTGELKVEVLNISKDSIILLIPDHSVLPQIIRRLSTKYAIYGVIPDISLEKIFMDTTE